MSDDPEIEEVVGPQTIDKAVMVGTTGIAQLKAQYGNGNFGRFEIIQDVGYSSESSAHLSNDERQEFVRVYSYTEDHPTVTEYKVNVEKSNGNDNDAPQRESHTSPGSEEPVEQHSNESQRKFQRLRELLEEMEDEMDQTLTEGRSIHHLAAQAEMMVFEENRKTSTPRRIKIGKKSSTRVKEWLKECGTEDATPTESSDMVVDSSCDASGEYTTNDSDCDSGSNNADTTFPLSRSGTGSVETVVPLVDGDEQMPRVLLRSKKRRNRERPWSVTELCQLSSQLNLSPFSTSEGALNTLLSSSSSPKISPDARKPILRPTKGRRQRSRSSLQSGVGESGSEGCRRSFSFVSSQSDNHCSVRGVKVQENQKMGVEDPIPMHVEDQSSVSDQVWDGYQDPPYFSEPYSEMTADEDQVKKLMNFGDDYRAFISSQSDSSSSCSSRRRTRPSFQDATYVGGESDSDSEREDLHDFIAQSCRAFHKTLASYKSNNSDSAELLATCQTNLKCLEVISEQLDSSGQGSFRNLPLGDLDQLQELTSGWQMLKGEILVRVQQENSRGPSGESRREIEKEMSEMRNRLTEAAREAQSPPDKLDQRIARLQVILSALHDTKGAMLAVNLRVHRLVTREGSNKSSGLRDEVTELYRQWDDAYEQSCTRLSELSALQTRCQQFHQQQQQLERLLERSSGEVEDARQLLDALRREAQSLQQSLDPTSCDKMAADLERLAARLECPRTVVGPAEEAKKRRSRLWRIVRASLPIHLALMLLYCLAWLMEPHCCDFLNTLNFSFSPTLRYTRGPPPV